MTDNILTPSFIQLAVTDIQQEVAGVKTFTLTTVGGDILNYNAGQFITFVAEHNGKEERRSYSFSSAPLCGEEPAITLKRVDNGFFSRYLIDHVKEGDVLTAIGTSGFYTLSDNVAQYRQIFFFAAGVGITPIFAIIKTALSIYPSLLLSLVYSNSDVAGTIFYNELKALERQHKNFTIVFLFSNSKDLLNARLNKWLIPGLLKKYARADISQTLYYTCGPFAYMRMVILSLEEQNIPASNIRKENFDTTIPVLKAIPADTAAHSVRLLYKNEEHTFVSEYPDTIRQAAAKAGIMLPYSCNTGKCGTCVAKCISGMVWHSYNEVLTDEDINKGLVLTCVGYPVNGDVTIQI